MITWRQVRKACEDLCLARQTPERASVQNAGAVACERRTVGVRRFGIRAMRESAVGFDSDSPRGAGRRCWIRLSA